jgi:hypothetical protein
MTISTLRCSADLWNEERRVVSVFDWNGNKGLILELSEDEQQITCIWGDCPLAVNVDDGSYGLSSDGAHCSWEWRDISVDPDDGSKTLDIVFQSGANTGPPILELDGAPNLTVSPGDLLLLSGRVSGSSRWRLYFVINGDLSRLRATESDFSGESLFYAIGLREFGISNLWQPLIVELLFCVVDLDNGRISHGVPVLLSLIAQEHSLFDIEAQACSPGNFDISGDSGLTGLVPGGFQTLLQIDSGESDYASNMEPKVVGGVELRTNSVQLSNYSALVRFELTNRNANTAVVSRLRCEGQLAIDSSHWVVVNGLDASRSMGVTIAGIHHWFTCLYGSCPLVRNVHNVSWGWNYYAWEWLDVEIPAEGSTTFGVVFQSAGSLDRPSLTCWMDEEIVLRRG